MTAHEQLSKVIEIISRGLVSFGPDCMGYERYSKMLADLIADGFTQDQACARVASLMKQERSRYTSAGFKRS